ncbi:HAD family hydrolase [Streptomyces iconiensis]|uniref:HAD family phosphatase n=1 Tax=Streptomyces iconiensis TaxID=1384038 RepID=A0ABT7A434_9ACTN|nr:HAD family phosphatase [Streptomyces iconiensis]MDJ1136102.1 HAD family phosphatase [Streptomyces iconiensis]
MQGTQGTRAAEEEARGTEEARGAEETGEVEGTQGSQLPYGAALFDLDGTLVDTEPRSRSAWVKLFAAHGVPVEAATLAAFAGRPGKEAIAEHAADFPGCTAEELYAEAKGYSEHPDLPPVAPVPGAVALLHRLREASVPLAVVTSGTRDYAHGELSTLGVLGLFDTVITADDVTRGKPHPEGYLAACAALGTEPERAVVFEDAPAGIEAAKSAGAYCVAVTVTQPAATLTAAGADLVVPDLTSVHWPVGAAG